MKWSRKYDACLVCNSTESPYWAHGKCKKCYRFEWTQKEQRRHNLRRFDGLRDLQIGLYPRCRICQRNEKLVVHHIDGNAKNNNLANFATLCTSCHGRIHNTARILYRLREHRELVDLLFKRLRVTGEEKRTYLAESSKMDKTINDAKPSQPLPIL